MPELAGRETSIVNQSWQRGLWPSVSCIPKEEEEEEEEKTKQEEVCYCYKQETGLQVEEEGR